MTLRRASLTHYTAVTGQLQEMEMIRQKVFQLEQAQMKMKQEYAYLLLFALLSSTCK